MKTVAIIECLLLAFAFAGCRRDANERGGDGRTVDVPDVNRYVDPNNNDNNRQITLSQPGNVTLNRGQTAELALSINRVNTTGPLSVEFSDLPDGVSVENKDQKIERDSATYRLKASNEADLVQDHEAKVTVKGEGDASATKTFRITVRQTGGAGGNNE